MDVISKIANDLLMDRDDVVHVALTADMRYREVLLRRPGKEPRHVWQPSSELRLIQRWCADKLFCLLPVHAACFSYVKNRNIAMHAAVHRSTSFLARIDIRHFFPSIRRHNVAALLAGNLNALRIEDPSETNLLSRLVTRRDMLVIGAPSSPVLSNAIMFEFDSKWSQICEEHHVIYSRYADDIYLSTSLRGILSQLLVELKADLTSMPDLRFSINRTKDLYTSRKRRRRVTGIVLTPDRRISIGRDEKRRIKSLIHKALTNKVGFKEIQSLLGKLSYVDDVEPLFSESLTRKYGAEFRQELTSILRASQSNPGHSQGATS
jgi:hypothetical protein